LRGDPLITTYEVINDLESFGEVEA